MVMMYQVLYILCLLRLEEKCRILVACWTGFNQKEIQQRRQMSTHFLCTSMLQQFQELWFRLLLLYQIELCRLQFR
jgi:hypothetical protein